MLNLVNVNLDETSYTAEEVEQETQLEMSVEETGDWAFLRGLMSEADRVVVPDPGFLVTADINEEDAYEDSIPSGTSTTVSYSSLIDDQAMED